MINFILSALTVVFYIFVGLGAAFFTLFVVLYIAAFLFLLFSKE
jgi:hypothetical protein